MSSGYDVVAERVMASLSAGSVGPSRAEVSYDEVGGLASVKPGIQDGKSIGFSAPKSASVSAMVPTISLEGLDEDLLARDLTVRSHRRSHRDFGDHTVHSIIAVAGSGRRSIANFLEKPRQNLDDVRLHCRVEYRKATWRPRLAIRLVGASVSRTLVARKISSLRCLASGCSASAPFPFCIRSSARTTAAATA
jgi:hypothetical protein